MTATGVTPPEIRTASGLVRGTVSGDGVLAVRGIPYAAPPAGERRFQPPVPPASWTGVRDATAFGPTALKADYPPPFDALLPEVGIPGDDCLNLNVWTPGTDGGAPVLVWLHGGAFANGSGSAPCYDGTAFARDGAVLVTLNYRLGADGFAYFGDPGTVPNLGLLDQVMALRWVRDNIAAFGGDPDRITVFGQSAGAMSIGALLAMPDAAGLFRRAVLQSGAAHHSITRATASLISRRLAALLGVDPSPAAFAGVPPEKLLAAQQQLRTEISLDPDPARWGEVAFNLMPFEPVIDGTVLPRDPYRAATEDQAPGIELLIGTNTDEFRLFTVPTGIFAAVTDQVVRATAARYELDPDAALAVYRDGRPDAAPGELHARLVTDWFYRIPALRLAEAHGRQHPGTAYVYEFAWQPPTFGGLLGACHAAELPFVFGTLDTCTALLGEAPPAELSAAMRSAWIAFAATGSPGWPAYEPGARITMRYDTTPAIVTDPLPRERELWQTARPA
ncbi:MAG TPA: carboxylesterase/lipase family protein [Trebonia sp.]|nr:carboxylesterase/lipase family protein [Trebonia sp.]